MSSPFITRLQATPHWNPLTRFPADLRPASWLANWLLGDGSLTARLQVLSKGELQVGILHQAIERPTLNEQQALGMPLSGLALVREVVLYGQQQPWVFARSVLPLSSLNGRLRRLRKQDQQPLGKVLFRFPTLQRSPVEVAAFAPGNRYVPVALQSNREQWGRRSIFRLDNKPLLVSEVFLDDFVDHCEARRARESSPDTLSVAK